MLNQIVIDTTKAQCEYCKQWGKEKSVCLYCGATIHESKNELNEYVRLYRGKRLEDFRVCGSTDASSYWST
jgi:hypothetical protein